MCGRYNFSSLRDILIFKAKRIDEISKRVSIDKNREKDQKPRLQCRDWGKEEEVPKEIEVE